MKLINDHLKFASQSRPRDRYEKNYKNCMKRFDDRKLFYLNENKNHVVDLWSGLPLF